MNTKYIGILLMAGKSTRMNGIVKQYYVSKDDDEPMYIHSLKTLVSFVDYIDCSWFLTDLIPSLSIIRMDTLAKSKEARE